MQVLNRTYSPPFKHIYVEKKAMHHPNTEKIIAFFSNAEIIEINHYKDVFSRGHQNFSLQKKTPKLILAVKEDNLIYEGAKVCDDFGNQHFYYTSTMMNCIYDCEYCYLQGMYPSANIVIFINIEDIFMQVEKLLEKHPVYLCVSYDTDILALENVVGYGRRWLEFAAAHKQLSIELRTKSANFHTIKDIKALDNGILAWTLSPEAMIHQFENKTPALEKRLTSIKSAIDKGWKVRLCFDPILYHENWKMLYSELIDTTFTHIPGNKVYDISIGVFRVSKDYLKKMRKQRLDSQVLHYPYETKHGICSYSDEIADNMIEYVYNKVVNYVDEDRIYTNND